MINQDEENRIKEAQEHNRKIMQKGLMSGIALLIIFLLIVVINFIAERNNLLESANMFKSGINAFNSKNYQVALDDFEKVTPSDKQNYDLAQTKIKETKVQLSLDKIDTAKKQFANNDFKGALSTLQEASTITDQPIAEISTLMPTYKDKEEKQVEKEKVEAEKQARQAAIVNMKKYENGIGPIGIAVTGVKTSSTVNGDFGYYRYVKNSVKDQFVWLDIAACNSGSNVSHVNPNHFTLSTKDGYTANYDEASFDTKYFDATNLSPNSYSSGWLIFIMPKADEYTLHFNSIDASVDKDIIMNN